MKNGAGEAVDDTGDGSPIIKITCTLFEGWKGGDDRRRSTERGQRNSDSQTSATDDVSNGSWCNQCGRVQMVWLLHRTVVFQTGFDDDIVR